MESPEVSSIMRELAGRSLTGTYLYSLCVKPDTSTTGWERKVHVTHSVDLYSGQILV